MTTTTTTEAKPKRKPRAKPKAKETRYWPVPSPLRQEASELNKGYWIELDDESSRVGHGRNVARELNRQARKDGSPKRWRVVTEDGKVWLGRVA